jgi:hypothetical protein
MVDSTRHRNALARALQGVPEGKIPAAADIRLLEEIATPEADNLLDQIDQLKLQKLQQAESRKSTDQSQPTTSKLSQSQMSQSFGDQGPSGAGRGVPILEEKKRLTGREKDYFQFFERRFGPLIVLILYFAMADIDKAVFYAPTPEECREVAPHLARVMPKVEDLVHMPKVIHEAIVTSDSTFTVGMVTVGYLDRIGVLEKILPWVKSWASRTRELSGKQTNPGTVPVSNNGAAPGPDDSRQFVPVDQLGVVGIGEQYRAEP